MLCLTSFLVLHSTTCGLVCIYQQVGQLNRMKEHTRTLISATCYNFVVTYYSVLKEKKTYISSWSDLSTYTDWSNQQSLVVLVTDQSARLMLVGVAEHRHPVPCI